MNLRNLLGVMWSRLPSFRDDRRGNVLIVGTLALPVLIGVAGLVVEYGSGVLAKVENQRVADLAAYAGALAYADSESVSVMTAAARSVAVLNGVPAGDVSVALVDSPKTSGAKAVSVTVATGTDLVLSRLISDRISLTVSSGAFAEVGVTETSTPGCMLALSTTGGIVLSGGTGILGPDCTVSSNAGVTVPCGTQIKTLTLNYNSMTPPSQPCASIVNAANQPAPLVKTVSVDPLSGNAAISTATARIATVNAMAAPSAPTAGQNKDIDFGWNTSQTQNQASQIGCSASWNGGQSKWTLSCAGATVNLRHMTVQGGINVDFNLSGSSSVTYNFKGSISNTGSTVRFPSGNFNIAQGISTGGGTTTSFGSGTFRIGRQTGQCNWSNQYYSICNVASLTFAGPSTFELHSGIFNTQQLTLGGGVANSYWIGPSSTGYSINTGGGSTTLLYDTIGAGKVFRAKGDILTSGGSCLKLPANPNADVDGNISVAGALILGAGIWTIDGYLALGPAGGGAVTCDGASVSLKALTVSLVLSGSQTPSSGNCASQVFCVANGYSNILLTSPTTGAMSGLAIIGPVPTGNTSGVHWMGGGSNGQIAGAFYFPNAHLQMSGGASIGGVPGRCMQVVAARVTLSGGTSISASECIAGSGGGGSSTPNVSLVR